MLLMQTAVRVHERHLRPLHQHLVHAAHVLDLAPLPQLYVVQDARPNAFALGVREPLIGLTTGLLDLLDEDQIRGVLGHELGHIQAGHQLYRTALTLLVDVALGLLGKVVPLTSAALLPIQYALLYWYRCAELTCDRAQMLVQRDFDRFVLCEMKFASGAPSTSSLLDPEQFLAQADEAAQMQEDEVLNRVIALWQAGSMTHPFPVWRVGHMHHWVTEGAYLDIMRGHYARGRRAEAQGLPDEDGPTAIPEVLKRLLDEMRRLFGSGG
jgi:Zn-dependent protease with chaperone function